jgi:hypothetical protein
VKRAVARLFDHLVGQGEQLVGNLQAKRLRLARDPGGIIPFRWAASFRNPGRHYPVTPGRLRRNRQVVRSSASKRDLLRRDRPHQVTRSPALPLIVMRFSSPSELK